MNCKGVILKMNYEQYINQLNEMYNEIYPNGVCLHYDKCKSECDYELNFYRCRIGKDYGKQKIKVLIVGKEDVFPKPYTGEKIIYQVKEPCTMKEAGYNNHYLRTFYTVASLLLSKDDLPKSFHKNDMSFEKYENLRHCFAMTNYYKCVFTNDTDRSNKKTSEIMEKNCSEILIREISVLKPDIVIIQGKGHPTFWNEIKYDKTVKPIISTVEYEKKTCKYKQGLYSAEVDNHKFYIIDAYHPTSHGIWEKAEVFNVFNSLLQKALKCF